MLRRGQTTTFPERLDITERAAAGQSNESRLRQRSAAPCGLCANGEASVNSRDAPV